MEGSLSELQMQRDNARGQIQETFQSYKAILERVQVGYSVHSVEPSIMGRVCGIN